MILQRMRLLMGIRIMTIIFISGDISILRGSCSYIDHRSWVTTDLCLWGQHPNQMFPGCSLKVIYSSWVRYQPSHQIRFFWRQQAQPQCTDTPKSVTRDACSVSKDTPGYTSVKSLGDVSRTGHSLPRSLSSRIHREVMWHMDNPWQAGPSLALPRPAGLARHKWGENCVYTCVCQIGVPVFLDELQNWLQISGSYPFYSSLFFLYFW